ncbi:MAG: PUR family DNA/RNA-binding protein [Bacteroidales bacterium]|nr:PUR family DNA/RNA-binding protein [Bacteroidales bacterium]
MDGYNKNEGLENNSSGNSREEIFSKVVRAGKRTYFLDVKATKRNDYYLTITESKKKFNRDGRHYFEKHKVFLYKEDFDKFSENLKEVIDFIKENAPEPEPYEAVETVEKNKTTETVEDVKDVEIADEVTSEASSELETTKTEGYSSDVEFDDLGDKNE